MGISIPGININPGIGGASIPAQAPIADAGSAFLQAYLASKEAATRRSNSSSEHEYQMAMIDLRKQEQAALIAKTKHDQEIAKQQGTLAQLFAKTMLPHLLQTGQVGQPGPQTDAMMQQLGMSQQGQPMPQQGGSPSMDAGMQALAAGQAAVPAVQQAGNDQQAFQQFLSQADPEAVSQFTQQNLDNILKLHATQTAAKPQVVQMGDVATQFVPGKGFVNPYPTGPKYVQSLVDLNGIKMKQEMIQAGVDAREQRLVTGLTNQFNTRVKPFRDRAMLVNQALMTITDAQGTPYLTSSAIANFVQAADQKAQLRYQLLQYFKNNIDPSVKGWAQLKSNLLATGKYPASVYTGMIGHLHNLSAQARAEYEQQRSAEIRRHPVLEMWLPNSDEYFSDDFFGGQPDASNGGSAIPPAPGTSILPLTPARP